MYHPLKSIERKWNAHTPKFLHNGSKENIIFQLTLVALIFLGFVVKDKVEERSRKRWMADWEAAEPTNLSGLR